MHVQYILIDKEQFNRYRCRPIVELRSLNKSDDWPETDAASQMIFFVIIKLLMLNKGFIIIMRLN